MEWLSLMFGGAGRGWLEAALLIGLFWAALAHPDRIRSVTAFRLSGLLLGLAIVAPVLIQVFLIGHRPGGIGRPAAGTDGLEMAMYASAVPPVLTMLAVVLGLDSIMPRGRRADAEPTATADRGRI